MAINPESQYPGKIAPSTADYPYGAARNITVPGDGTGTPWEAALVNDIFGFQQALLSEANLTPSGTPEKATASQYVQALNRNFIRRFDTVAAAVASTTLQIGDFFRPSGYATKGDGGENTYEVVAAATGTDDGGSYIDLATHQAKALFPAGSANVKQFGAEGSGTGDYISETRNAAAFGGYLRWPAGSYRVVIPDADSTGITPAANTVWEGDGKDNTTLTLVVNIATFKNLIGFTQGNLTIRNMKIEIECVANGSVSLFQTTSSGLQLIDCIFDGGVTDNGAATSHSANMIQFPDSGTQEDILVMRCEMTRWIRTQLKTNAATSTQRRISYIKNWCHDNYVSDLGGFNSPNGVMDDVLIWGNSVTDGLGEAIGILHIPFGGASPTNVRIESNTCTGLYSQIVHLEEAMGNVVVTGNTFECTVSTTAGSVISVLENNIGPSLDEPHRVIISNNTVKKSGTQKEAGTIGIWATLDGDADVPGREIIISDNIVEGFQDGFSNASLVENCIEWRDNLAIGCTNGYSGIDASAFVKNNTSKDCDVGVKSTRGGMIHSHTFMGCTVNVDSINTPIVLVDPTFIFEAKDITASTTTDLPLIPLAANTRIYGIFSATTHSDSNNGYSSIVSEVHYDGTTLTPTTKAIVQPGTINTNFTDTGAILNYAVFTSANKTGVKAQVSVSGSLTVAV